MDKTWDRGRLLALSGGYWKTFTLHAGVHLDLFTRLGERFVSAEALASETGADPRGVRELLNALSAMGLLVHDEGTYANTPESARFLVRGAREYVGDMILHHRDLVSSWSGLDRAVRTGKPVRERGRTGEEKDHFLRGMRVGAMGIAPGLAGELDLEGCRTLLDLGGGPGTYAVHFCLENPEMRATVFDLPGSEPVARETIERFGVADRVSFQPGDYHEDEIQGRYDAVWSSHIYHGEGPDGCRALLGKAVSALNPGGRLFIHEFILNDRRDGPLFPALFSLNMLVNTPEGRSYSESELRGMLRDAGVSEIRRLPFQGPSQSAILEGRSAEGEA
jgi:SAM-dependent methyltransferase